MKSREVIASLCWLLFSLCVAAESLRLGVGTVRRPGTGFMAFGVSVLLGALSIILLCQSLARKDEAPSEPLFAGKLWKRVLSVLFAVLLYAQLMPAVGYILATFLHGLRLLDSERNEVVGNLLLNSCHHPHDLLFFFGVAEMSVSGRYFRTVGRYDILR